MAAITEDDYHVQVRLQLASGLPEDVSVNTFAFRQIGGGIPDGNSAIFATQLWFNLATDGYLGPQVSREPNAHSTKVYRILDPEPRVPVASVPFTTADIQTNNGALPNEISVVTTFYGDAPSGIPAARRRGRIYIGPLADFSVLDPSGYARPSQTGFINGLLDRVGAWLNVMEENDMEFEVWSRTQGAVFPVTRFSCDNEYDIQRRRGSKATVRTYRNHPI